MNTISPIRNNNLYNNKLNSTNNKTVSHKGALDETIMKEIKSRNLVPPVEKFIPLIESNIGISFSRTKFVLSSLLKVINRQLIENNKLIKTKAELEKRIQALELENNILKQNKIQYKI